MKKIVSFFTLMVALITMSCNVFASEISTEDGSYTIKFVPSSTEVNVGDSFDVSVYLLDATDNNKTLDFEGGYGSFYLNVAFNNEFVSFNKSSSTLTNYGLKASNCTGREKDLAIETATEEDVSISSTTPLVVLNFTAKAKGTAEFIIGTQGFNIADQNFSEVNADNTSVATTSVVIKSGSTGVVIDGEDFTSATDGMTSSDVKNTTVTVGDSVYNMGENGKVYTFFKKTVDPLTAGSYGVKATIGGKEYKFPGKANVPANGSWVIKFIAPNGTFQDGTTFDVTSSEAYFN